MEENARIQIHEYIKIQNTNNQWVTTDIGKRIKREQYESTK